MSKLLVKLVVNALFTVPLLLYYSTATPFQALMASLSLSILAFFLGDQWILDEFGNAAATLADGLLAVLFLWAIGIAYRWGLSWSELAVLAVVTAAVEFGYHLLLRRWDVRWYS
ncbi:DUF2512 family protein [Paenibacillus ehimensis]|uniref:DUF2512 family protein n=1 Tax=Paenibacillus ehimensis TaxID=79264 RepID=A0ABT8VAS3_9BACL|nr:DUF2512 family protein [Paenibacillus ehimensis]MDO3678097.1 DUF2512 family protein [Paenibacillus ehimensis]MEC0210559.1 DUF2512 family protein [Paenibacillus ehimensis]